MPIYAYRCANCGHAKDVLQRISDPLLTVCPVCGEPSFEKQVTAAGFRLKGSGWYVTDFRDEGKAPKNEHEPRHGHEHGHEHGAVNGHDAAADGAGASAHGESDKSGQAGEGGGARESGKPAESSVSEGAKSARSHDAAGPAAATAAASSSSSDSAPKQA